MRIALVGERYGLAEASEGKPWVGPAGRMLRSFLRSTGYSEDWEYLYTNVVNRHEKELRYGGKEEEWDTPVYSGKYLGREYKDDVTRVLTEVAQFQPDLVVALGGLAAWAFLGGPVSIQKMAGTIHPAEVPVLVTWNPAAILHREDNLRPFIKAHLLMGRKYVEGRLPTEGFRMNSVEPDRIGYALGITELAVDIETCKGFMDMCGVGTADEVDVYTFASWPEGEPLWSVREFVTLYRELGDTLGAEIHPPGWDTYCKRLGYGGLPVPAVHKSPRQLCFHNGGGFDVQYMLETTGLDVRHNYTDDTRIMGRCVDPEGRQGLKDLAPRYLGWKKWGWDHKTGEDK